MIRRIHETPQEYYYKMYVIGKKRNLSDAGIEKHIVNGINDYNLKSKISNKYVSCNQLLNNIISYWNSKMKSNINEATVNVVQAKKNNGAYINKIKCYNCSNYGLYSIKSPEPHKNPRCEICHRTSQQDRPVNADKITYETLEPM